MYTSCFFFFFFNDPATTEIYTLSLHDALPIRLARTARRALGGIRRRSTPFSRISPSERALGGRRRRIVRAVIDLPLPDSPTSPRTSLRSSEKLMSFTTGQ